MESATHNLGNGNFGHLAQSYKIGRRGVPVAVIDYLWSHLGTPEPRILDVGCGTGIPTRQIAQRGGHIVGTDIDATMIATAHEELMDNIDYVVAPTHDLPVPSNSFDAITIFSALHWFTDNASLAELYRVLKLGGIIFVANKRYIGDFVRGQREIFDRYIAGGTPQVKRDYRPRQLLETGGFTRLTEKTFLTAELFDIPSVLAFWQSVSTWNLIPEVVRPAVLTELEKYYTQIASNGTVERELEITVQVAHK